MVRKGSKLSAETKRKIKENHADIRGEKNPFYHKSHSKDTKLRISNKVKELWKDKSYRSRVEPHLRKYHHMEDNPAWDGGKSFETYPKEFKIKRSNIIKRDKKCYICNDTKDLVVHHIDYNKSNNSDCNLLTLCRSCHGRTNWNKQKWKRILELDLLIWKGNKYASDLLG